MRRYATPLLALSLLLPAAFLAGQTTAPDNPNPQLKTRPDMTPDEKAEALRISKLAIVNGRPYDQPSEKDKFLYYLNDSYGLPAFESDIVRAGYTQLRGKPEGWGTDLPGFGQRFGSAAAVNAINGNMRYAMGEIFHEDLRYIPCHGCSAKKKIENALLAEVTARHDEDGHRFFTVTPIITDFSGPIVAHSLWYPGGVDPESGVVAARLIFATRIGGHLFREFVLERMHKEPKYDK
ncbi:hypothetical protein SAMN05421770_101415 [Granulicella rosea]|uniref:Uncharacterized protein n=1 Tax=Granulicella rosea TaxID=474952 RepID=A0A239DEW6_9BACT|nr:hypothetical protein [Granulicella rosea]SNS30401.1 hypothetical protein SAMN05421770_101415 [Granulicella rosea]